jgi:hypothetical protein
MQLLLTSATPFPRFTDDVTGTALVAEFAKRVLAIVSKLGKVLGLIKQHQFSRGTVFNMLDESNPTSKQKLIRNHGLG